MDLKDGQRISAELIGLISPYCKTIAVAGSIRRSVPYPKDIEIVALPDRYKLEEFFLIKKSFFRCTKSGAKYKRFRFQGENVDLFLAEPNNYGWILFIRTGSRNFNIRALKHWKRLTGGTSDEGYLYDGKGEKQITPLEIDVFNLLQVPFIDPKRRSI